MSKAKKVKVKHVEIKNHEGDPAKYAAIMYPKFEDDYFESTFGDNFKVMKKLDNDTTETALR